MPPPRWDKQKSKYKFIYLHMRLFYQAVGHLFSQQIKRIQWATTVDLAPGIFGTHTTHVCVRALVCTSQEGEVDYARRFFYRRQLIVCFRWITAHFERAHTHDQSGKNSNANIQIQMDRNGPDHHQYCVERNHNRFFDVYVSFLFFYLRRYFLHKFNLLL